MMRLRSSISSSLKGHTLKKGAFFSALGGLLLLSLAFIPFSMITLYGTPLFILSCLLIARGLIPYRRLLLEEMHPNELHFDGEELFFLQNNKPLFRLHKKYIAEILFKKNEKDYGISLQLTRPLHQQVVVLTSQSRFLRYLAQCKKRSPDKDLFLPFFTQHSYQELLLTLRDHMTTNQTE